MTMIDIASIYKKLVQSGEDWADKNGAADMLEETRHTVLNQIIQDFEGSYAAKESMAKASDRYEAHIRAMVEARKAANLARVKWEAQKIFVELIRTKAASERAANREAT